MSLFHLYAAVDIVPAQVLRPVHVGFVLVLVVPAVPDRAALSQPPHVVGLAVRALAAVAGSPTCCAGGDDFWRPQHAARATSDVVFGVALIVLVLEACRRTSGWIMPVVSAVPRLRLRRSLAAGAVDAPRLRRRAPDRLPVQTLEGIFGVAVDVSSSLIILFTIYGAFLQHSGAGKFFLDLSLRRDGRQAQRSAGRTVVLASFLLGGPSGSGVATTVTIGSVAYPMLSAGRLRQGRRRRPARGGRPRRHHLAAGARRGRVPDRRVPEDQLPRRAPDGDDPDGLYYLSLFLMVELDARKFGMRAVVLERAESLWRPHPTLLVPLRVARLDRRVHADGLLADPVGVLRDRRHVRASLLRRDSAMIPTSRDRSSGGSCAPGWCRRWRTDRSACSTSRRRARPPASSSASSR